MIIKEEYVQNNSCFNLLDYLPILEETISPKMVPILDNYTLREYMVNFKDLYRYAEQTNKTFQEAFYDIKNENRLDYLYIAIDEALIYDYPQLLSEFNNLLLIPQNENSKLYQFCEICMDGYIHTGDMRYVDYFLEADQATVNNTTPPAQPPAQPAPAPQPTPQPAAKPTESQAQPAPAPQPTPQPAAKPTESQAQPAPAPQSTPQPAAKPTESQAQPAPKSEEKSEGQQDGKPAEPAKTEEPKQGEKPAETNPSTNPSNPANTDKNPSWFSQKWTTFKNWMNKLGSTKDEQSTWFSNIMDKLKNIFSTNNNQQQINTAAQTNSKLEQIKKEIEAASNQTTKPEEQQKPTAESVFFEDRRIPTIHQKGRPATGIGINTIGPTEKARREGQLGRNERDGNNSSIVNGPSGTMHMPRTTMPNNQQQQPIQASADIDLFINEVYRPRRLYRHRYLR